MKKNRLSFGIGQRIFVLRKSTRKGSRLARPPGEKAAKKGKQRIEAAKKQKSWKTFEFALEKQKRNKRKVRKKMGPSSGETASQMTACRRNTRKKEDM